MNNTKNYTKYSARDAESVRSLDKWKPSKGTGRLKKKILAPPPTERLWLNLPPSDAVKKMSNDDPHKKYVKQQKQMKVSSKNRRDEVYEKKKAARQQQQQQKKHKDPIFTFGIEIPQDSSSRRENNNDGTSPPIPTQSPIRKITSHKSRNNDAPPVTSSSTTWIL